MNEIIPHYPIAYDIILDYDVSESISLAILAPSTELLYGLLHSRYLLTKEGQERIVKK